MPLWGKQDTVASKPLYANTDGSSMYGNTYGVSDEEILDSSTIVDGVHSGWVSLKSYQDMHGNTRYKSETLVAQSDFDNTGEPAGDQFFANT